MAAWRPATHVTANGHPWRHGAGDAVRSRAGGILAVVAVRWREEKEGHREQAQQPMDTQTRSFMGCVVPPTADGP